MRHFLLALIAAVLLSVSTSLHAGTDSKETEKAGLRNSLQDARSAKDSLKILYDIFDLSTRNQQIEVGEEIYTLAERLGDVSTQLDILRLLTSCYKGDAELKKLEDRISMLPSSKERDESILFVKMRRISFDSHYLKEDEQKNKVVEILATLEAQSGENAGLVPQNMSDNITEYSKTHNKMFNLYTLVEYLRNYASGELLKEYIDKLVEFTEHSDIDLYAINNVIFTEAANIYSDAGDNKKSVDADRHVLKVIDALEKDYASKGRKFRNYDISRYTVYRRMIRNYEGLEPGEVDALHEKVLKLASTSSEVRADMESQPRYYAFYYMAKGDYNAAIPRLKELLRTENTPGQLRKQVLEALIEAADKTGDDATKMEALTLYNTILDELNKSGANEKYKELQIKYDVEALKNLNAELEYKNRNAEIEHERRVMTFVVVAFVILAIVLILSLFNWGKFKRNANKMGKVVDRIYSERNHMRNLIYYDYASHDELHELEEGDLKNTWQKRLRKGHTHFNDVSMFMTTGLVNDLMYIASFGRDHRRKFIHDVSVDSLLQQIYTRARELTGEGPAFSIEYPEDDFKIVTDPDCLTMLLGHVLAIALPYSPKHVISLGIRRSLTGNLIEFVITLEGLDGAKPEDPLILEDFITNNDILGRKDAGLFICRMISLLLKSTHYPDMTHKDGARYVFSLPDDLSE